MKNTTIEIYGVQDFYSENRPNIILEFPGYLDELVIEISFCISYKIYTINIDYRILHKVFFQVPDNTPTSFIIDNFPKAEKFKLTKISYLNKKTSVCEVSNIWSEKNRTMFLDYYPEYLLPNP